MKRLSKSVVALALLVGLLAGSAAADDKDNPLAAYEKAGKPGAAHKALEPLVGEWTYTAKLWIKPGADPIEMSGKVERKWIFGGRFVQDTVQNEKPNPNFKGMGLIGYDNTQKKYTSVWIDSMSTSMHAAQGTVDKDGKKFTFTGTQIDPVTSKSVKTRAVIRIKGKDQIVHEDSRDDGGKWVKVMEITYARKGK